MTKKRLLVAMGTLAILVCVGAVFSTLMPSGPGVTKANFDRIQIGMARAEVEAIFDGPNPSQTFSTTVDGREITTDEWFQLEQGIATGIASLNFQDEMVVHKKWFSLPETFFQKIGRWLHL